MESGQVVAKDSFPLDSGITGISFTENRAIFGIMGKTKYVFRDIDYVDMSGVVKNFLFLPLYGYNNEKIGRASCRERVDVLV